MSKETHSKKAKRTLARVSADEFVGRADALRQITKLAAHGAGRRGLLVLAAPAAGASELLRQSFDLMFETHGDAAPIYFSFSRHDHTTTSAARRFLHTFLLQLVAHRRGDESLLEAPPAMRDLIDLVAPSDYEWAEGLVGAFERALASGDERAVVRACLNAPQRAAARGARTVVLLDDVHLADRLRGEIRLGVEIARVAAGAEVPFVLSGLRRRMFDAINEVEERTPFDGMSVFHLEPLGDIESRTMIESLAMSLHVEINDETRDLLSQQLAGKPFFISAVLQAAQSAGASLASFRDGQQLYVNELMGGRINRYFNSLLEEIAPAPATRRALVRMLHESAENVGGKSPVEAWRRRLNLEDEELQRVMRELHVNELASFNATFVEVGSSIVWRDYLRASYRLEVAAEPRALVVADTLVGALKRAPQTMARHYRKESALKLRDLCSRFDFQRVPASLLHNDRWARTYKGVGTEEVASGLNAETDLVRLPQIVHTASCASFHPPILLACDEERCAVAHGFDASPYTDANQVVWLAAEIESKLEAGRALTEVWCDRLLQVAHACGFTRAKLWLIAPEGFSEEANELLDEREAFGSNRQQLEFLTARLEPDGVAPHERDTQDEFEMVIPMGSETELIAAHTVEQIARRLEFEPEAINQIKTALVEACINASEHSLSPDRKIYQRFRVESDKLVVTVSSRGVAISPPPAQHNETNGETTSANGGSKGRRGWGLKLIRTLMDEVEFERVDDGTRIRMTKYLRK